MANDWTKVLDTVTPEIFEDYMQVYATDKSAFVQAGVAVADARVSQNIAAGGTLVNMPFWNDLSGDDEVLGDGDKAIETGKITAGQDIATVMYRGKGWAVNEMAAIMSGGDPLAAVMGKIGNYWLRREQQVLMSTLNGLFATGGALRADHLNTTAANIDAAAVLDTKQLLGDRADSLAMLVMHSKTYTELQKQNVIDFVPASNAKIEIPTYLGYRVVVDDALAPTADGTYTTYLLSAGAFGRNTGTPSHMTTFETARDAATGTDKIYTRRAFVYHPYGVKWTDTERDANNLTPTNADLAKAANWQTVYDLKNIGIVGIQHTVGNSTPIV